VPQCGGAQFLYPKSYPHNITYHIHIHRIVKSLYDCYIQDLSNKTTIASVFLTFIPYFIVQSKGMLSVGVCLQAVLIFVTISHN